MSETEVVYIVTAPDIPAADPLPEPFVEFLVTRRRSLIAELRQIETLLRLPQSIPPRTRPR